MTPDDIPARAREMLAAEYDEDGWYDRAHVVRSSGSLVGYEYVALRAIEAALALSAPTAGGEVKSDWFAGDVDADGNDLITVRKDEWDRFQALKDGPPYTSDSWGAHGYVSPAEEIDDMANVGRSLMDRIASVVCSRGPFKGWSAMDDPAEIVTGMANWIDENASPPSSGSGEEIEQCDEDGSIVEESDRIALREAWDMYASYMGDPDGKDDTHTAFEEAAAIIAAHRLAALKSPAVERDVLADAVHRGRFPADREPTPFADEDRRGREYCYRIAGCHPCPSRTTPHPRQRVVSAEEILPKLKRADRKALFTRDGHGEYSSVVFGRLFRLALIDDSFRFTPLGLQVQALLKDKAAP